MRVRVIQKTIQVDVLGQKINFEILIPPNVKKIKGIQFTVRAIGIETH